MNDKTSIQEDTLCRRRICTVETYFHGKVRRPYSQVTLWQDTDDEWLVRERKDGPPPRRHIVVVDKNWQLTDQQTSTNQRRHRGGQSLDEFEQRTMCDGRKWGNSTRLSTSIAKHSKSTESYKKQKNTVNLYNIIVVSPAFGLLASAIIWVLLKKRQSLPPDPPYWCKVRSRFGAPGPDFRRTNWTAVKRGTKSRAPWRFIAIDYCDRLG